MGRSITLTCDVCHKELKKPDLLVVKLEVTNYRGEATSSLAPWRKKLIGYFHEHCYPISEAHFLEVVLEVGGQPKKGDNV